VSIDVAGSWNHHHRPAAQVSAEKKRSSEKEEQGKRRSSNNLQSELVALSTPLARFAFDQMVGQSSRAEQVAAYHAGRQRQCHFFILEKRLESRARATINDGALGVLIKLLPHSSRNVRISGFCQNQIVPTLIINKEKLMMFDQGGLK
jgi:hypothetical protein